MFVVSPWFAQYMSNIRGLLVRSPFRLLCKAGIQVCAPKSTDGVNPHFAYTISYNTLYMYSCTWPRVIAHLRKTTHWRSVYITKVVLLFIPVCLELQQIHPRGCLIRFLVYTRNHTQNIHRWLSICNTCGFEPLLYTSLRNPYIIAFICGSPYALK